VVSVVYHRTILDLTQPHKGYSRIERCLRNLLRWDAVFDQIEQTVRHEVVFNCGVNFAQSEIVPTEQEIQLKASSGIAVRGHGLELCRESAEFNAFKKFVNAAVDRFFRDLREQRDHILVFRWRRWTAREAENPHAANQ
jgi:hypothetical protein